jgi:hypothetical protein
MHPNPTIQPPQARPHESCRGFPAIENQSELERTWGPGGSRRSHWKIAALNDGVSLSEEF